jgi:hypothetical protein
MGALSEEIATAEGARPRRSARDSAWRAPPGGVAGNAMAAPTHATGSYRTFSRKLAPSLTAVGGALVVIGGLGSWVRATQASDEGLPAEQVVNVMGNDQTIGWILAFFGVVAILVSGLWLSNKERLITVPLLTSVVLIGFVAYRLKLVDRDAAALAADARTGAADFFSFHAGFGWGAWLLLVACVFLGLGAFVGVLRRLDLDRGVPDES